MVVFEAEIERFSRMGEKTGWTYVFVPKAVAQQIKADCKKSYRVKGKLDQVNVSGMALVPMGEGDFIIALKTSLRRELKKEEGAVLHLELEEDLDFKIEMPDDLELCLSDDPQLLETFLKLPKSHRNYYINWLNTAKTEVTRTKRLTQIVVAMDQKMTFGEMIRSNKS
ncbi:YdeI/OmpD-associated family protein [Pedobacter sp. MR2016-24]|uniref:YdeI/OmpD-associated family protein n=1 Tax=Pedobacter sp. MR2016-24 TaxID=2994466 RepID=UPI0022483F12|nr:YdeI/OmpD-associated family protein [Pedobacter sp. MR2016-24]MCX2484364.1 YdeI/OmpD-associated family protein [Pedobacter sp. MR2016-24]